ncbi:MAG: Fic family protein [Bdellovibrionota bacterium]
MKPMPNNKSALWKIREEQLFRRGAENVRHAAGGIKKINSQELVHLNQLMTETSDEPWRFEPVEITIPGGQTHLFNLVSNPINRARDICGQALQIAGNGEPRKAALYLYTELVLAHLFKDANRRTAVLATLWILENDGIRVDENTLLNIPLGDLRDDADRKTFEEKFRALVGDA